MQEQACRLRSFLISDEPVTKMKKEHKVSYSCSLPITIAENIFEIPGIASRVPYESCLKNTFPNFTEVLGLHVAVHPYTLS